MNKITNFASHALSVFFIFNMVACADSKGTIDNVNQLQGIIGGTIPAEGSVAQKSTVAIGRYNKTKGRFASFCTGVVVSKDFVLTAAHCMEDDSFVSRNGKPEVLLYFGNSYENYDKALERVSTKWEVNDKYAPIYEEEFGMVASARGDVALLKVENGIPLSAAPVKIGVNHLLKKDQQITAAGWGVVFEKHEDVGAEAGGILTEEEVAAQESQTPQNPDAEVEGSTDRLYETNVSFLAYWKTHLVFQQGKQNGVCRGDSGGPAYFNTKQHGFVVIGTVRGAHGFTDCSGMVEYTNLSYNIDFIQKAALKLKGNPVQVVDLKKQ